ncbi:hypothetical protein MAR_ORF299 [Marseillevirus marseillevirus]|uniref:Uncharacterized protein n=1 Tax=Marseillevirus marseillevirus TaxID=694581 RepID=D2XAU5_GBMV|nr:hypothetical protein MAR_ORF299 [Marseillevirus marseillevirus]ADB04072.1 hypothetical protein MAR_ORF299 [Marseillevirus marseillevirus]
MHEVVSGRIGTRIFSDIICPREVFFRLIGRGGLLSQEPENSQKKQEARDTNKNLAVHYSKETQIFSFQTKKEKEGK